jgi:hypothetical protein
MPRYRISLTNSEFESSDEANYPSIQAATKAAIAGGSQVVSDSIAKGALASSVEMEIEEEGRVVARKVVTLSVADLSGGKV